MSTNAYIDIATGFGCYFNSGPTVSVRVDTNWPTNATYTTNTLGSTSNMANGYISLGTLGTGSHTIQISVADSMITKFTGHSNKCIASIMTDNGVSKVAIGELDYVNIPYVGYTWSGYLTI